MQRLLAQPAGDTAGGEGGAILSHQRLFLGVAGRLSPLAARAPRGLQHLVLQRAANRLLARPLKEGTFDLLEGRWLRLEVRDLGVGWYITRVPGGLRLVEQPRASVTIRGDWHDFLLLTNRHKDPGTLFFRRHPVIKGGTKLGLTAKNFLDSLDPEHLPPWLWNVVERIGQAVQEKRGEAPQAVQDARGG